MTFLKILANLCLVVAQQSPHILTAGERLRHRIVDVSTVCVPVGEATAFAERAVLVLFKMSAKGGLILEPLRLLPILLLLRLTLTLVVGALINGHLLLVDFLGLSRGCLGLVGLLGCVLVGRR